MEREKSNNIPAATIDIQNLPAEILQTIFRNLSVADRLKLEEVCRTFWHVMQGMWELENDLVIENQCGLDGMSYQICRIAQKSCQLTKLVLCRGSIYVELVSRAFTVKLALSVTTLVVNFYFP